MLILFDYDGVVADSLDAFHDAIGTLCRGAGHPELAEREAYLALFDGNLFQGLRDRGLSDEAIVQVVAALPGALAAAYEAVPVFPGVGEAIGSLSHRHAVFVVTSNVTEVVTGHLARHGVAGVRDVLGADAGTSKVDKIHRVAARFAGEPVWYVGDTLGDIREGRRAGATTVAVTWGWHDETRLRRGGPDHVVRSPAELVTLVDSSRPSESSADGSPVP